MITLGTRLSDPFLDSMNFLNEVTMRHPAAISFAPGRPAERLFAVDAALATLPDYAAELARARGGSPSHALDELAQYGRTNGVVCDLIARQLALDEGLEVGASSVVVTNGCQEAMLVVLLTLFERERDVLLSSDPAYQGITAAARLLGIEVEPVAVGDDGISAEDVAAAIRAVHARGRRARALYVIPDFDNPSGVTMSLEARRRLAELASAEALILLEDTAYRPFRYEGDAPPMLKALAPEHAILLGSYAKSVFPGLRLGYVVADIPVQLQGGQSPVQLSEAISRAKSLTSINTSPLMQAVLGGVLQANGGSLAPLLASKLPYYRRNRDHLLGALDRSLADLGERGVRWNRPRGGFFITVSLPFGFRPEDADACARDSGVIVCPMSLFTVGPCDHRRVRLSFSYVAHEAIEEGVRRFGSHLRRTWPPGLMAPG
ncbi:PLP-dependent aminotransferase family protein [Sorangium sp. So ce1097]|uniref:aminotransferase-like domain-containing protein n=1 Tax=Sorangium sp. So ce1097 TaxID=3133330 RepID=UPI003F629B8F